MMALDEYLVICWDPISEEMVEGANPTALAKVLANMAESIHGYFPVSTGWKPCIVNPFINGISNGVPCVMLLPIRG